MSDNNGDLFDRIHPIDINEEMESSYIDYAMFDSGYRPDRGYVKSARPVSDTMGQFHPHGDSAIYDLSLIHI